MTDLAQRLAEISGERRSYVLQHLPRHLAVLRQTNRLYLLLTDIFFLEAKAQEISVFNLAADFTRTMEVSPNDNPHRKVLELLEEAIRRDIHFIDRHAKDYPQGLFQCLWNLCWWYDCPEVAGHYDETEGGWPTGDSAPPWTQGGARLHKLMESWRRNKEATTPGFFWLRSICPPRVQVGHGQKMVFRGHRSAVHSVACSPDGGQIVSGSSDTTVRIWDVESGKELHWFPGAKSGVAMVAYSEDGRWIICGDYDGTVCVLESETHEVVGGLGGHLGRLRSLACSPDGRRFVSGWKDGAVRVWDIQSRIELFCHRGHTLEVNSVAFSPNGRHVVSASNDKTVRIWSAESGIELHCLRGHESGISSVAYSPDGRAIASGSEDKTVRVWDARTGSELCCLRPLKTWTGVRSVAYSPDGRRIASGWGNGTVRIFDTRSGTELGCLRGHTLKVNSVAFFPNGRYVVTGSDDKTVRIWAAEDKDELRSLPRHEGQFGVITVAYSPEGRYIASSHVDDTVRIWDKKTGIEVHCLLGHGGPAHGVTYAPDGRLIGAGSMCTVCLWDAKSGARLRSLRGHDALVEVVDFSPDGRRIVSGSQDGTVRMWNTESGEELRCFCGNEQPVRSVAYSPDGRQVVSGANDGTVRIWDVETAIELRRLSVSGSVHRLAYSADGRKVIIRANDNIILMWDINSGRCVKTRGSEEDFFAIAKCLPLFRHRTLCYDLETLIEDAVTGKALVWYPDTLRRITTDRAGRSWTGATEGYLCITMLEGAEARSTVEGVAAWQKLVWEAWECNQKVPLTAIRFGLPAAQVAARRRHRSGPKLSKWETLSLCLRLSAAVGLTSIGVAISCLSSWSWLLGAPTSLFGLCLLSATILYATGAARVILCPQCRNKAFLWRRRKAFCTKCKKWYVPQRSYPSYRAEVAPDGRFSFLTSEHTVAWAPMETAEHSRAGNRLTRRCSWCGRQFGLREDNIGERTECPYCGRVLKIKQGPYAKREPIAETSDAQWLARLQTRVDRNDPCPCGSGKKYKRCCLVKEQREPD